MAEEAYAATYATYAADEADAAADAARAAYAATYTKIINYGLSLVEKCDDHCCQQ